MILKHLIILVLANCSVDTSDNKSIASIPSTDNYQQSSIELSGKNSDINPCVTSYYLADALSNSPVITQINNSDTVITVNGNCLNDIDIRMSKGEYVKHVLRDDTIDDSTVTNRIDDVSIQLASQVWV